jgi:hypothetical protein
LARLRLGIPLGPCHRRVRTLFVFGPVHTGIEIGCFHEPKNCTKRSVGINRGVRPHQSPRSFLAHDSGSPRSAVGAAPRTATNDRDHRIMFLVISSGLFLLFLGRQGSLSNTWRART